MDQQRLVKLVNHQAEQLGVVMSVLRRLAETTGNSPDNQYLIEQTLAKVKELNNKFFES